MLRKIPANTHVIPGVPLQLVLRRYSTQVYFSNDDDYLLYIDRLQKYAHETYCAVHAFVLLPNHVHLLLTPEEKISAAALIKRLGQRYPQDINRKSLNSHEHRGDCFHTCTVQQVDHLLQCQRFIELVPLRAGIVDHPGEYTWSSFRANAYGEKVPLISHHALYMDLGLTEEERQTTYREFVLHELKPEVIDELRYPANNTNSSSQEHG